MASYLTDGWQTAINFALAPTVEFRAKEIQPPELDGGPPIDTTVMPNTAVMTFQPPHLVKLGETTLICQYDPNCYNSVRDVLLNKNGLIYITFPNGRILTFWGWVSKFTPSSLKISEFPTAEVKVISGNQDNDGNEVLPTLT